VKLTALTLTVCEPFPAVQALGPAYVRQGHGGAAGASSPSSALLAGRAVVKLLVEDFGVLVISAD
jgi:hypothetical protein